MKTILFWKFKSIIRSWLLIYIDLDNPVYIDFAYTSDPRVFEVLIYWVDIESPSKSPGENSDDWCIIIRIYVRVTKVRFLYISYWLVWEPKLDRAYCCDLASKTWSCVYISKLWIWKANQLIDWWLCCVIIYLNQYVKER